MNSMVWNVYYHNFNRDKIEIKNVFSHGNFKHYAEKYLKECSTKEEFEKELKAEAKYYFLYRSEWELIVEITKDNRILLKPWVGSKNPENIAIDVTDDKSFNWIDFAKKCVEHRQHKDKVKIDIFTQLNYLWDDFVSYCWNNKHQS